eukprot:6175660-Pleurochrysis_carterae.AAC.6
MDAELGVRGAHARACVRARVHMAQTQSRGLRNGIHGSDEAHEHEKRRRRPSTPERTHEA